MNTLRIKDQGPVAELEFDHSGAGILLFRGRNGSGKSKALEGIDAALHGGKLTTRDGSLGAFVEGFGVRVTFGKRTSRSGELEVVALEGADPSLLVNPGIKDPVAADAQRIRTILKMVKAEPDLLAFADLVGGEKRLRELCREASLEERDIPAMAAAIKRDLESAARKYESEAKNFSGRAQGVLLGLNDMLKDLGSDERVKAEDLPPSDVARAEHEAAVRQLSQAEGAQETTRRLFAAASEASMALSDMAQDGTRDSIMSAEERVEIGRQIEAQLVADFEAIKLKLSDHRASMTAVGRELEQQRSAAKRREQLERAIAQAEGVTPVSDEELAALRARVDATRAIVESTAIIDRAAGVKLEAKRLQEQAQEASIAGSELRHASQATDVVVTQAVAKVCGEDLRFSDGRLWANHERGWIYFDELSLGEAYARAIDIAVSALGEGGVLTIDQIGWEGLDPDNRRAVHERAVKLGVLICTAECDAGPLRVEMYQP